MNFFPEQDVLTLCDQGLRLTLLLCKVTVCNACYKQFKFVSFVKIVEAFVTNSVL